MLTDTSPEALNDLFHSVCEADKARLGFPDYLVRWLFADRLKERGVRREMGFEAFEGPRHVRKFFSWLRSANLTDTFPDGLAEALAATSAEMDQKVFAHYALPAYDDAIQNMARYNAQDFLFQRAYPMPERCAVRTLLDFGAGHGRMANLAFNAPAPHRRVDSYIAVEGIPSTYFTQHFYWAGLGLKVWDYFEHLDEAVDQDTIAAAIRDHDVVHLPTWQIGLIPDAAVDMVTCVQVLKELPGELVAYILPEFARVTQAAGALYVRDHLQFHNPNHMPMDLLIQAQGYTLEFAPQIKDRTEIHGLPRIWRKVDPGLFL